MITASDYIAWLARSRTRVLIVPTAMGRSVKGKRRVQAQSRLRWGKAPPLYALVTGAVALLVGILAARFFAAPFAVETPAAGWRSTSDASFAAKWGNVPCDIDRFGPGELTAELVVFIALLAKQSSFTTPHKPGQGLRA